ncbi:T7SS effector LXG polymorphic toxin [Peribacillus sp. B-H-3]|uniref:T7SS effector LXG polymorphic toxin n=1 Tax=Peribacillus sp. B-H-3 TaxID=3400420 RepID=UPI003B0213C0
MSNKRYDANALFAAMENRAKQYEDLHKQLAAIRKEFDIIVKLDDELQGKGAESIKGFYGAQIDAVDAWIGLVKRHIAFFKGISGDAKEAKLGEDTIIHVPFLEDEVANADQKSKDLVTAQKSDLKAILDRIHDIIDLKQFSDEDFQDEIQEAERKRTKTIAKVNKLDSKWLKEYAESEDDQVSITALMKQLRDSSTRGGKVSPLYFDAKSYKKSEVYKELQDQVKEDEAYLKVKKKEAEERRHRELEAELAKAPNAQEYLKAADKIGFKNLYPYQQDLYKNYAEEELKRGAVMGLFDAGKDFAKDIFNFVMDPEAAENAVYESVIHYKQTYQIMKKAIVDSYEKNMVHGDWYSRAHWVTYAIGSVASNAIGSKGMGAVAKTGMATTRIAVIKGASKARKFVQIPQRTPWEYQFAVDGQVPYNTVNSKRLLDRLSAFSAEGKVGKGIDKTVKSNDVVPYRPSNSPLENHHGVMDVWAKHNVPNYVSRGGNTPTVALTKEQHAATKAVYREWLYEKTGKKVGGKIDWQSFSPREIQELTERMLEAANVPKSARQEYYNSFNKYNYRE